MQDPFVPILSQDAFSCTHQRRFAQLMCRDPLRSPGHRMRRDRDAVTTGHERNCSHSGNRNRLVRLTLDTPCQKVGDACTLLMVPL